MNVSSNWKALQAKLKPKTSETGNSDRKELWFEVDDRDLERSRNESCPPIGLLSLFPSVPHSDRQGRYIAMDCEYVGVGPAGAQSVLARLTLVNWHGAVLLDTHVRSPSLITDYRTPISGIRPEHLRDAPTHVQVLELLPQYLKPDTILVGHGLVNDMAVLMYSHPRRLIRDTSKYRPFRAMARGKTPSLKKLAKTILGVDIQGKEHDSAEDARAAMLLYKRHKADWENYLFRQEGKRVKAAKRAKKIGKQL